MTDELKYDPELPYVVCVPGRNEINSRFKYENEALAHRGTATWLEVIDTTPKPKIPEDAEFLLVEDEDHNYLIRRVADVREPSGHYWFRESNAMAYGDEEVVRLIGDAEVTVLVRKEER